MIANLDGLNKAFESKIRLGIMSVLMANESVDFTTMKSLLELTANPIRVMPSLIWEGLRFRHIFKHLPHLSIANNNRLYFF